MFPPRKPPAKSGFQPTVEMKSAGMLTNERPVSRMTSVLAKETVMMLLGSNVCTQFAATFRLSMSTKLVNPCALPSPSGRCLGRCSARKRYRIR